MTVQKFPAPNVPGVVLRPARPLTDIEFCAWVGQAALGDRLEYHRGFLGIDVMPVMSKLPEDKRRNLAGVAAAAFRACEAGLVHLVQTRLGPDEFAYIAIARPRPGPPGASLSMRLLEAA